VKSLSIYAILLALAGLSGYFYLTPSSAVPKKAKAAPKAEAASPVSADSDDWIPAHLKEAANNSKSQPKKKSK
jgi:hypothetical protein